MTPGNISAKRIIRWMARGMTLESIKTQVRDLLDFRVLFVLPAGLRTLSSCRPRLAARVPAAVPRSKCRCRRRKTNGKSITSYA